MSWLGLNWINQENTGAFARLFSMARRGESIDEVQPGVTFRRMHADNLIETAEVISVGADRYGIPHVQYQFRFQRPNRSVFEEGQRMLALRSFADRYRERLTS